jgi:cell division protein FtsA
MYPLNDHNIEAIYGSVAQSFSDGENFQIIEKDIIGMTSDVLEGNFKIFIGRKNALTKIDTVLKKADVVATRKYFTADTTAKAVLLDSEMENGVAMIDFGGGCTSVSIYHGSIMRHYASIPFGGKSITNDIQIESEGSIDRELAENIKLAFGACMPEKLQNLSEKIIHIKSENGEAEKKLPVKYLSEIITARVEEIIMAILYEIQRSGFADKLRSGIVVTGGCAQTANLANFIGEISGYRVRTGYPRNLFSCQDCEGISETSAATSLGLIIAALGDNTINCAVSADSPVPAAAAAEAEPECAADGQLFPDEPVETAPADGGTKPPKPHKTPKGPKVTWTNPFVKIGNLWENIYESVNQGIENEEV